MSNQDNSSLIKGKHSSINEVFTSINNPSLYDLSTLLE